MEASRDDVIPAAVAAEGYCTACLEHFTRADFQAVWAHYALTAPTQLSWAPCRELTRFGEQWRQYGRAPQQAWQHWLHEKRPTKEPTS